MKASARVLIISLCASVRVPLTDTLDSRYAEWISNVVPVYKKNGKLRVCIDFRNLNKSTPMDGYPMPVADLLVDAAAGHQIISSMDGNAGYNQIFMAEENISKAAFRCPGHVWLFE